MSIRFDANADGISRTAALPPVTTAAAWTVMCWAYLDGDSVSLQDLFWLHTPDGGLDSYLFHGTLASRAHYLEHSGGVSTTGSTTALDTWVHFAIAKTAGDNQVRQYINGVLDGSADFGTPFTPVRLRLGNSPSAGRYFHGRISAYKEWTVALTAGEILAEMDTAAAIKAGVAVEVHLATATDLLDVSGNDRHFTATGTLETADEPDAFGVAGVTGTGAVAVGALSLDGVGTHVGPTFTGTGAVALTGPSLAGAGTAAPPDVAGVGEVAISGPALAASGTATAPIGTVEGVGAVVIAGVALAGSGTAQAPIVGVGAVTWARPTLAGVGTTVRPIGTLRSAEVAVRARLLSLPAVTALVATRVYLDRLPQSPTYPAVRVQLVSEPMSYHMRGGIALRPARIQVDAYAREVSGVDPYALADIVANAIHGDEAGSALSGWQGTVGSALEIAGIFRLDRRRDYDPEELRVVTLSQDYRVWFRYVM